MEDVEATRGRRMDSGGIRRMIAMIKAFKRVQVPLSEKSHVTNTTNFMEEGMYLESGMIMVGIGMLVNLLVGSSLKVICLWLPALISRR